MPLRMPRRAGVLLKTGQTTVYGGYADDGSLQKGLAKHYEILTTGQHSGTTNITLNAKTDAHSNNCVIDNNTGLMWSRYVSGSVGVSSDGKIPWTTNGSGEGIFAYATAANAASLAGFTDWRVANLTELLSLVNWEEVSGSPDATAFPSWPTTGIVWSSGTYKPNTTEANAFSFASSWHADISKTATQYCLLVRGDV